MAVEEGTDLNLAHAFGEIFERQEGLELFGETVDFLQEGVSSASWQEIRSGKWLKSAN
jgi:hypothetical protein